mmetsp:Transcript_37858/g.90596  ORF Transcript_37858/g.90596 Transcript_37858/m.90596 type:complete len:175 (-) Transcript_37858:4706-5230(-)
MLTLSCNADGEVDAALFNGTDGLATLATDLFHQLAILLVRTIEPSSVLTKSVTQGGIQLTQHMVNGREDLANTTQFSDKRLKFRDRERLATGVPGLGEQRDQLCSKVRSDTNCHEACVKLKTEEDGTISDDKGPQLVSVEGRRAKPLIGGAANAECCLHSRCKDSPDIPPRGCY